jgi:hypothetical protein
MTRARLREMIWETLQWAHGICGLYAAVNLIVLGWFLYALWTGLISEQEWRMVKSHPGQTLGAATPLILGLTAALVATLGRRRLNVEGACWLFAAGLLIMTFTIGYAVAVIFLGIVLRSLPELWLLVRDGDR